MNSQDKNKQCCGKCCPIDKDYPVDRSLLGCKKGFLECECHENKQCCEKCSDWSNEGGRQCIFREEEIGCPCHEEKRAFMSKVANLASKFDNEDEILQEASDKFDRENAQ